MIKKIILVSCMTYSLLAFTGCSQRDSSTPTDNNHQVIEQGEKTEKDSLGIVYNSSTAVADAAFKRAQYVAKTMLTASPAVQKKMKDNRFHIEIIGRYEVLTDRPYYAYLKGQTTSDGRPYDNVRGLGGFDACSSAEENILCLSPQAYFSEDVLVHEFGHSIKFNVDWSIESKIIAAYEDAKRKNLYPPDIYMMASSDEYWAEGTQAWFEATRRTDVNAGINTRAKIKAHDPVLAALLEKVYGTILLQKNLNCAY